MSFFSLILSLVLYVSFPEEEVYVISNLFCVLDRTAGK